VPSTNAYARQIVSDQFNIVEDIRKIDPQVLALFHSKVPERQIANRGEQFNPTDIPMSEDEKSNRFVLAGVNPSVCFILYEVGGIGYHHKLIVFSKNKKWSIVAAVSGFVKRNNFDALKQAISAGEFFDQPGYPQF
jgi:hypothetical protein